MSILYPVSYTQCFFTRPITEGNISDVQNMPIVGASIVLKGTQLGTVTDEKGVFMLKVEKQENGFLIISSVGYLKKEIPIDFITAQTSGIRIQLEAEIQVN